MMNFEYIEKDMFRQKSMLPLFAYRMGDGYKFLKMPFWEGSKADILWGIKRNPGYMVKMVNVVYCGEEPCWQQERTYAALPDRFDQFLPDLMELSLTHTIIGIRGEAVFVSQSLDHSTNIDQDVVSAFQSLFFDKN